MAYTFKDDGNSMTYYREYNKEVNDKNETLVGNWVEERALRDQIQTGRYQLWVDNSDDPGKTSRQFTKFTQRPDALDTYSRTLVHSEVRRRPTPLPRLVPMPGLRPQPTHDSERARPHGSTRRAPSL